MASFLEEDETVVDDYADEGDPSHDSHHDWTLQEVHAEEGGHSIQEQSLPMVVQPFSFVVFALDQSQSLEEIMGLQLFEGYHEGVEEWDSHQHSLWVQLSDHVGVIC